MASRMLERRPKQPTGRLLMTLNEAIADGFSYVRRSAPGTQSPVETSKSRRGSCRGFALLMMVADKICVRLSSCERTAEGVPVPITNSNVQPADKIPALPAPPFAAATAP
jgi:hypothetical protein